MKGSGGASEVMRQIPLLEVLLSWAGGAAPEGEAALWATLQVVYDDGGDAVGSQVLLTLHAPAGGASLRL